jgi:hypothetical protein
MNNSEYGVSRQGGSNPDRKCARFVVPGATLSCKERGSWHRTGLASEEKSPVVSISRKGLAFLTDSPPKTSRVTLLFSYSEKEEAISLEGRVIYSLPCGTELAYRYRVGVAFSPFSERKGHNSLVSLGVLDHLEKTHGAGNP